MHFLKTLKQVQKRHQESWNLKGICSVVFMSNFFPHESHFFEWKIGNTLFIEGRRRKFICSSQSYVQFWRNCAIFKGTHWNFWHRQFSAEVIFSVENFVIIIIAITIIIIIIVIIITNLLLFRNNVDTKLVRNCRFSL